MKGCAAICALLAVAGCAPQAADQAAPDPSATAASIPGQTTVAKLAPPSLTGEWRVAGVAGKPIDLPHAISASISTSRIKISSQCVEMEWSYRFDGPRLVTESVPVVSCDRGRYPEELAVEAALNAATTVSRTPGNGLEIASGVGTLLLFSQ